MKFSIAQALALVGTVSAATYSNTSFVPFGSGYFYDGEIYFDLTLPNSGFSAFSIAAGPGDGFTFAPDSFSGTYVPSGNTFPVAGSVTNGALDIQADIDFSPVDTAAEVAISGPLESNGDAFVGIFVVNLEGLPQLIEKRADQEFTVTVTATFSVPSDATSSSSGSSATGSSSATTTGPSTLTSDGTTYEENTTPKTHTATSTTLLTITSCSDDKCHETVVPTGVTIVTTDKTVYTTWCPETSIDCGPDAITVTVTEDCTTEIPVTSGTITKTETVTTKTTETKYYTPKKPTGTNVPPKETTGTHVPPVHPTTVIPVPPAPTHSSELPTWEGAANNLAIGSGSIFAFVTVLLSMLL